MREVPANLLSSRFMNILIEDAESLKYLTGKGGWTKSVADGRRFAATGTAFEFAKKEPIGKFNIVCYIPETEQFINMHHA